MIDLATSSSAVQAGALVGAVLLEAFVLYVGYGALERVATPVVERIKHA
ncbi:hypothetical protein NP511_17535 [Natrinema thermotolerans]|uniref:Uncharacterized protein n=1 Tax=Natrinema thermotolerans TaxID=121872 RepID=A0AAF0P8Z9_9EURY|nr:hypothetical protein [Natrinema thermotolerans]ELZ09587.1 hypothetical protein C478_15447 [Natrinema thermotolerans DSM 11552]WMT07177.1 hypothetical protein NP511_17535 [Natrinema thermotolerans]